MNPTGKRQLGSTDIFVTPIAMGCWPITGITSLHVTEANSLATLQAAVDAGINFFDTAYIYGYTGESEKMIAKVLGHRRDDIVIATKGGLHWESPGKQGRDGSPAALKRECEESLQRLNTDFVDLYYLHAPDPQIPLTDSAGALAELLQEGKARSIGISNVNWKQLEEFISVCPLAAYQPHYNMLQREIEDAEIPWCVEHQVSVMVYWPLLKGLLAGKLPRDHVFADGDGRKKYAMFQGNEWEKNQDFLELLRPIAEDAGITLAQMVLKWTMDQPGITSALVGAKRPDQIRENAQAMATVLSPQQLVEIDKALQARGKVLSEGAVR